MTISNKWIITYSGLRIELDQPERNFERFLIRDVAHALSLQTRFNGHCSHFYSVAEHSILVERWFTLHAEHMRRSVSARDKLTALLHDAPEYILGDMTSPQKMISPDYQALEAAFSPLIAARWDTMWPLPPDVKNADREMYRAERRDLFLTSGYTGEWAPFLPDTVGNEEYPFSRAVYVRPMKWTPAEAEEIFLLRFKELVIERDIELNEVL